MSLHKTPMPTMSSFFLFRIFFVGWLVVVGGASFCVASATCVFRLLSSSKFVAKSCTHFIHFLKVTTWSRTILREDSLRGIESLVRVSVSWESE